LLVGVALAVNLLRKWLMARRADGAKP